MSDNLKFPEEFKSFIRIGLRVKDPGLFVHIRVSVIYQCFHLLRDTPWIIKNHKKKKIFDEIGL